MSSISHDYQQLGEPYFDNNPALEDFLVYMEDFMEIRYNRVYLMSLSETRRIATTSRFLELHTFIIDGLGDMLEDRVMIPTGVVPADESFVASLEIKKASEELANSGEVCSVCLEGWKIGDDVKYSPCKHCFHPGCVDKWFKINHFCPLCRFELPAAKNVEGV
ncbi:uncharacterized RING finger protein P32A8.03c-like [Chenopodium quinoa]|uniref:RING-type E3 ubiquitin transferase n=1 Tax=Chenopodium quinoa TaxID=63459 RepID=A0A803LJF4_CHEQI|nr:uncharacterized RING finger protein P32A8.03c-like [Chenopodium quinoa]